MPLAAAAGAGAGAGQKGRGRRGGAGQKGRGRVSKRHAPNPERKLLPSLSPGNRAEKRGIPRNQETRRTNAINNFCK